MTSRTIDYHQETKETSSYKYTKVSAGMLEQFTLDGTAKQLVTFNIPARAMNLARSYLHFEFVVPAQTFNGVDVGCAVYRDVMALIDSMQLITASGTELMNQTQFRMFTKMLKKDIKLEEFLTYDKDEWLAPNRGSEVKGENKYYHERGFWDESKAPPALGVAVPEFKDQLEPIYVQTGGPVGAPSRKYTVRFPLGRLKGEFTQLDKSIYFPEIVELRVNFGEWGKIGFQVDDPNVIPAGGNPLTGALAVSNVHLDLATEQNQAIIQSLKLQVEGPGLALTFPRTYSKAYPLNGDDQNVSMSFTASSGKRLRRVYYTCIPVASEGSPYALFDIANGYQNTMTNRWVPSNVQSYSVKLDNNTLNVGGTIDCTQGQDWLANRAHLKESVIRNIDQYKREWHHQEDFCGFRDGPGDEKEGVSKNNLSCGIPLSNHQTTIEFSTTMASADARRHYIFAEVEKTILIQKDTLILDANASPY